MNYYSHHIGDYTTDTAHLSIIEDGAYRRLMDRYYTTETPLIADEAALFRLIRARSEDEKEAARVVLAEFFVLTDAGWTHKRCDIEIAAFRDKSEKATAAINKRWGKDGNTSSKPAAEEEKTVVIRPLYDRNTDVLLTNNQEPITNNQTKTLSEQSPDAAPVRQAEQVEDPRKQKRTPSADDEVLAKRIHALIVEGNAGFKKPNLTAWADDIRLMREIDGRALPDIWSLFQWVRRDAFWRSNVLSPGKLREKWDQLAEKRAQPAPMARGAPVINEKFNFSHLDRSGDARAAAETIRKYNITVPEGDEEIEI